MKSEDLVKYALMAAAVYLLYRWAQDQGWLETGVPVPALDQPPAGLPVEATAQPPAQPPPPPTEETLQAVAGRAMGAGWDGRLNADEWNHYYTELSGVAQTTDLFPPGDRGYRMTGDEYWQQRRQAGLGALARWPVASAWAN